jgi:antitoxin component YwqK of YwqJK toxin-antitoxin module
MMRMLAIVAAATLLVACWQKDVGRTYYANGKVRSEATVKNNVLDGHAVMYYENGTKKSEADYRAGVLHGTSVAYYESGRKKAEAGFKDGLLHGTSTTWSEKGEVLSLVHLEEGRVVTSVNPVK